MQEIIITWSGYIAAAVIGIILIWSSFAKGSKDKNTYLDELDGKIIAKLKESVDLLEKQQKENINKIHDLTLKVGELERSNLLMTEILQGRDKSTQDFQTAGMIAIKRTEDIFQLVNASNQNIERLYSIIEKYLSSINIKLN